ncbi:MAG: Rrf2 family transcriptional regulator [Candidatus Omnitrophota bacterium]
MWKLSTKGRYGSRLMVELALNYGKGSMLLKDIAHQEDISEGYLEHIIPLLKAAGLIHSARGAHGGYVLARPPEAITLKEIVQALEGSLAPVECVDTPSVCTRTKCCVTRDVWTELKDSITKTLEKVSLKDMVVKQKKK